MSMFDSKQFNPTVFLRYMETVESARVNRLIRAGIFVGEPTLGQSLADGVGGNYMQRNFVGRLEGNPDIYDGSNNITASSLKTFKQGLVAIGLAHAFVEKDFTPSITGKDFMSNVAEQLVEYWDTKNQDMLISVLKGIFASALAGKVVEKDLSSLSVSDIIDGLALQGDKSDNIRAVAMHSTVLNALKKANLVQAVKFLDTNGIQRDLGIYQWDSRDVIEDDSIAPTESYSASADTSVQAGKVYYTRSGTSPNYTYTKVASPTGNPSTSSYYEKTLAYPVYLLGANAFTYQPLNVKTPVEMWRQPLNNGGEEFLISRERFVLAPYGISFKSAGMSGLAPTKAELENGSAWEIVNDGAVSPEALPEKNIPLACIVFKLSGI